MKHSRFSRVLSIILSICLFLAGINIEALKVLADEDTGKFNVWDHSTGSAFTGGTGTESDPYLIERGDQLAHINSELNGTEAEWYSCCYYKLTANIDLDNFPWTPIGKTEETAFCGHFDGNGHTIKNLNLTSEHLSPSARTYYGLFGYTNGATISNLTLIGTAESDTTIGTGEKQYVALLIGHAKDTDDGTTSPTTIENCNISGSLSIGNADIYAAEVCAWDAPENGIYNESVISINNTINVDYTPYGYTTCGNNNSLAYNTSTNSMLIKHNGVWTDMWEGHSFSIENTINADGSNDGDYATITTSAEPVNAGEFIKYTCTITAKQDITDKKLCCSSGVMVGDTEQAVLYAVSDINNSKIIGFKTNDNHVVNPCLFYGAQANIYFADVNGVNQDADFYWFGSRAYLDTFKYSQLNDGSTEDTNYLSTYGSVSYNYNSVMEAYTSYTSLSGSADNPSLSFGWNINMSAGETKTYSFIANITDREDITLNDAYYAALSPTRAGDIELYVETQVIDNYSSESLDSHTMYYSIDNGTETEIPISVVANKDRHISGTIDLSSYSDGNYKVKVWVMNPNGMTSPTISEDIVIADGKITLGKKVYNIIKSGDEGTYWQSGSNICLPGDQAVVNVTAKEGYEVDSYRIYENGDTDTEISYELVQSSGTYTFKFTIPESDVVVEFKTNRVAEEETTTVEEETTTASEEETTTAEEETTPAEEETTTIEEEPTTEEETTTQAHEHSWYYMLGSTNSDYDTVKEFCNNAGCDYTDGIGGQLIINAPKMQRENDGNSAEATLTGSLISKDNPTIYYVGINGTEYSDTKKAPTAAGTYRAYCKIDHLVALVDYEIYAEKSSSVTVDIKGNTKEYQSVQVLFRPLTGQSYEGYAEKSGDSWIYKKHIIRDNYNLIATATRKDGTTVVVTSLESITGDCDIEVYLPSGDKNSKLVIEDGTPNVLVGGLNKIAADTEDDDYSFVTLNVSKLNSTAKGASYLIAKANTRNMDFYDFTLTMNLNGKDVSNIGDSNDELLTIAVPFDSSDKKNIKIYRYHNNEAQVLSSEANENGEYIEVNKDYVVIHAKKFSTYAIGYEYANSSNSIPADNKNYDAKTGVRNRNSLYATAAMIAGLSAVSSMFAIAKKGTMTKERKEEIIRRIIAGARGRKKLRKLLAYIEIFMVLLFYYMIAKSDETKTVADAH